MTDKNLAATAITSSMLAFMTFMPTPAEIVDDEPDLSLRINEVSAAAVSAGLGIALSIISRDGTPLVGALVVSAVMIAGYEYLARTTDKRIASARIERLSNVRI